MSLVNDNRVHKRQEVTLKDKCSLIIPANVHEQIKYLHQNVSQNTEWSGIIIYETVSGSIEDPKNWVIKIEEIIPMDVGTSGYTEYEIDPADDYMSSRLLDALDAGKKMGHIHTHHSMNCFFSGTDMSELHDNAPNHASYLSLIVNYQKPSAWIAKVAIIGETSTKGVRTISSDVTVTRSWAASDAPAVTIEEPKVENIDQVQKLLYQIDCNLEVETAVNVEDTFAVRVTEIEKEKGRNYAADYAGVIHKSFEDYQKSKVGFRSLGGSNPLNASAHGSNASGINTNHNARQITMFDEHEEMDFRLSRDAERSPLVFSPGNVRPFLEQFLAQDYKTTDTLADIVLNIEHADEKDYTMLIDILDEKFEVYVSVYFKTTPDHVDYHAISLACMELLAPYVNSRMYDDVELLLEERIMPQQIVSDAITKYLTGIELEQVIMD